MVPHREQQRGGLAGHLEINGRRVGPGEPVYVIAELSGNHRGSLEEARELVRRAAEAGADAVKLQTLRPEGITLDAEGPDFQVGQGTEWTGRRLHDLYREVQTPWEWHGELKELAGELGMDLFSSPFEPAAVDFLEELGVPAFKVASFELVDTPLIERMARSGKPLIISTGMGSEAEIAAAVEAARRGGAGQLALLKCTSAYPAPLEEMNLRAIGTLAERFAVPVGLSDHSHGIVAPVAAVALGASIVEKHLTLERARGGPDASFSLEPAEFGELVDAIRDTERALGEARLGVAGRGERALLPFRRSLFAVREIAAGEALTEQNVRSIRPGSGLPPAALHKVLGRRAAVAIPRGTPLAWELIEGGGA